MSELFAAAASVLMIAVMAIYFHKLLYAGTKPNITTWLICFVVMGLNTATYYEVVHGDLKKIAVPVIATLGITMIFSYSLLKGVHARMTRFDLAILAVSLVVIVFWRTTGDAVMANLALQAVLIMSFVPTVRAVLTGEATEHPLPWIVAILSYVCQMLAIFTSPRGWQVAEIVFPFLNGVIGNASVPIAIYVKNRPQSVVLTFTSAKQSSDEGSFPFDFP